MRGRPGLRTDLNAWENGIRDGNKKFEKNKKMKNK